MESQTNFETQNLEPNISSDLPPKNSYKILFFLSSGLFLIVSSVLATLLIAQKSSNPTQTAPTDTEETEPTPTETAEPVTESITSTQTEATPTPSATSSNLKTYENKEIGFSFKYPSTLKINEVKIANTSKFGGVNFIHPGYVLNNNFWNFTFYQKSEKTIDEITSDVGYTFTNIKQSKEIISINNIKTTKITTTSPDDVNWYFTYIVFSDSENNLYVFSNNGVTDASLNQDILNTTKKSSNIKFSDIYSSFKFN